MKDLTQGKTLKVILQFAFPVLIGNLFNLAYNLADTRIIGSCLGNHALAAVGSVSTLSDVLIGFIVGLANGFAVLTSRFYGMGNQEKVRKNFALSLEYGLIISAFLMVVSSLGLGGIFRWLHVMEEHSADASAYIRIIILGLMFSCLYNVLAGSLRAIGDVYTPLVFLIVSTVINVGLDLVFVKYFSLGVAGAALATVISQLISAILCIGYVWVKYPFLRMKRSDFLPDKEYNLPLLGGGFSMGMMSCLVAFGTLSLQTAVNSLGTNVIVAHAGTRKLTSLYMLPFSVFGTTMATFCGQNYGANRMDRIRKGLLEALGMTYLWVGLVVLATWTVCPYLITAITATKVEEIIGTAVLYQKFDTAFYLVPPTITILRNSLQGMGDHVTPVFSSSLELIGKVLVAALLTPVLKYWGIILAEPIVWIIMVIPLIISMYKRLRSNNPVLVEKD